VNVRCAIRSVWSVLSAILIGAAISGCSRGDGKSDYDRMMEAKQGAANSLASSGAKFEEKQYPVGKGWVVNLHGLTISDDLLKEVKKLGNVAELDMAKSTVTDEHLRLMHELNLHVVLTKLDLSNTAVTDAALQHLDGCIFLSELNLTGTKATPAGVERFKKSRQSDPKVRIKNTTVKL
jgi:hypothetical protein